MADVELQELATFRELVPEVGSLWIYLTGNPYLGEFIEVEVTDVKIDVFEYRLTLISTATKWEDRSLFAPAETLTKFLTCAIPVSAWRISNVG